MADPLPTVQEGQLLQRIDHGTDFWPQSFLKNGSQNLKVLPANKNTYMANHRQGNTVHGVHIEKESIFTRTKVKALDSWACSHIAKPKPREQRHDVPNAQQKLRHLQTKCSQVVDELAWRSKSRRKSKKPPRQTEQ